MEIIIIDNVLYNFIIIISNPNFKNELINLDIIKLDENLINKINNTLKSVKILN